MDKFRKSINRFLYNNADKGIPNLMMWICIGTIAVYIFSYIDPSNVIYSFIRFDRSLILKGQVWRLFTYVFVSTSSSPIWMVLLLFCYYSIGRMVEQTWGTLKFNLFYLSGVLIMDIFSLLIGTVASVYYLNLSLFLALATMYPDNRVLFMYVIPVKMKYLAWVYLAFMVFDIVVDRDFSSLVALINYVIFFGKDCLNVLPGGDRVGSKQFASKRKSHNQRPNENWAAGYKKAAGPHSRTKTSDSEASVYKHKCTICGRTDVSNPELDFRYCSKCRGYCCYCQDHINNHAHIV